ncbi:DUF167 domain-containing protein [Candidatus Woesearchaeota archaeon]|nr:DUF167 domain-containing protein [Candidatus Woesearchaeota archaeon]
MKITVIAKPGSGRSGIIQDGKAYTVWLKAPARGNKANVELVKLLSLHFGRKVRILAGLSSRRKILEVQE